MKKFLTFIFLTILFSFNASANGATFSDVTVWRFVIPVIIGLVIGFITVSIMASRLKSVRSKHDVRDYIKSGSFNLTGSYDNFAGRHVSRSRRNTSSRK